ncbi:MAG: DUF523 domain-containing protein [Dethiobacteria bacterium]|jgi:uncharacterized protein YbbK (DUF523 family)
MYLVSACLLGIKTRYDGKAKLLPGSPVLPLNMLIPVCPEQLGGLSTPRLPAEIIGGGGKEVLTGKARVTDCKGKDVTDFYLKGARETLYIALLYGIKGAFLKDGSPSCGCSYIYDGSFSGEKISGLGVTAALLQEHGFAIYNEKGLLEPGKPCN